MTVAGADGLVLDWGSGTRRERSAKKRVRVGATAEMLAVGEGDGKDFGSGASAALSQHFHYLLETGDEIEL